MGYDCPHCQKEIPDAIPKTRLDKEILKSKAAEEEAKALSTSLAEAEKVAAKATKALEPTATELQAYKQKEGQWQQERAIISAGISDPEGVDFARVAYQRLPAEGRPSLGDWLADPTKLPKAVQAYLPAAPVAPAAPAAPGTPAAPAAPPPRANAGALPGAGAPVQYDAQAISRMTRDEYKAHREAVFSSVGMGAPAPKG